MTEQRKEQLFRDILDAINSVSVGGGGATEVTLASMLTILDVIRDNNINPTNRYIIANTDVGASTSYFQYIIPNSEYWYIMREAVSGAVKTYTYVSGTTASATAWTNRASQTYVSVPSFNPSLP